MEDYSFIVDNMQWSFSRLESFNQCKYGWKKHYIDCEEGENNAFASYGTLCHNILERYARGDADAFDLADEYNDRFDVEIPEQFPPNKYVDMRESYYNKGLDYFENITDRINQFEILGVEKRVDFECGGKPFVGYIDLLLKKDDEVYIVDHKSASVSFKKNGEPNKASLDKVETYKRQLYLYSKALIDAGIKVDWLVWNFFNTQSVYKIPWREDEYLATIEWAENLLKEIDEEEEWEPTKDFYYCHYICDYRKSCMYVEWQHVEEEWDI